MTYVYKEPETWDELFDALDAVTPENRFPICDLFKQRVARLAPKNLSVFNDIPDHQYWEYIYGWNQIVTWWDETASNTIRPMSHRTFDNMLGKPTPHRVDALRKFLRSLLVKAHTLYGSQQ